MERRMTQMEARQTTVGLLREHGLVGWKVKLDNARRRAGMCDYRNRVISLSKPLMAHRSYEDTMMTITHEIAHAIAGYEAGHGARWVRTHRSLGGNGKRCYADDGGLAQKTAPWVAVTVGCSCSATRYRAPQRLDGWLCRQHRNPMTWKRRVAA